MRKFIGIIGYPLKHTISPAFQQAALNYYKLDIEYKTWEVEPGQFKLKTEILRQAGNLGANITIPYKERALDFLDTIDPRAKRIGAVNTVLNENGRLSGFNTDAEGFIRALEVYGNFQPAGKRGAVIGAGGAARAACFALTERGLKSLIIINRDVGRAQKLQSSLKSTAGERKHQTEIAVLPSHSPDLKDTMADIDLLVNCTPVGMMHTGAEDSSPLDAQYLSGGMLVYDLVYNPLKTRFLADAKKTGARTLGGLWMLVLQGAASFKIWTGLEAPLEIMFQAALKGLEGSAGE